MYFLPIFSLLGACSFQHTNTEPINTTQKIFQDTTKKIEYKDTLIKVGRFTVLIKEPNDSAKGNLLLLPGWNFSNTLWCDSSTACIEAKKRGWRIIAPNMMQSIYASKYYPQTRKDLRAYPTLLWLTDTVFSKLENICKWKVTKNFVLGLSTGGRGVAMVVNSKPTMFAAAAALSGDFDQSAMPSDVLTTLVYGPYKLNSRLWKTIDNPTYSSQNWKTPIYIGHAFNDNIVPYSQSYQFYLHLKPKLKAEHIVFHRNENLGHTWKYWQSELPAVYAFFDTM